jgi:glycosyltransferase involved in cell wall biosynthesis
MFLADLRGTRAGGAKFVVFWHSVFSHFLLRSGRCRETVAFWDACRLADAAITLTRVDETFFRMYGVPAAAIAYCDPDMMADFVRCNHPKLILWMGRFVELKRPLDALKIFERVQERHPDAELVVLGDGDCAISLELRRYLSSRPALAAAVRLEGFKSDVRPYLEKAGVGLVTSRFEGYGHSIVEMKMASLPVVAYEMPWLDTLQPHSGALTVPQGDIDAAADAISGLFDDAESCRAQGERARRSYSEITATDQVSAYSEFFDAVGCGDVSGFSVPRSEYVRNVMETLSMHIDTGLAVHESDIRSERDEFWRRNRNYRAGRIVSWPYRIVKRLFAHWWNDGK